jgi:hypothetical protein
MEEMTSTLRRPSTTSLLVIVTATVAVILAYLRRWITDDAFISFRYADNLVTHRALVFNIGEHVEGMSNFLWTLWIAVGLKLGVAPETWTIFWGLVSLAAVIAGLGVFHMRARRSLGITAPTIPLAAVIVAAHTHVLWFTTSGLETMAFTALMLAVYLMLTGRARSRRFDALTGVVAALCALSRPEGPMVAGLGTAYLFWIRRGGVLPFLAGFLIVWAPVTIARVLYYGDYFPNTVYAKSNAYGRLRQGVFYVYLYFRQYWPLLLGIPLVLMAWRRLLARPEIVLAAAFAGMYTVFVVGVAGDFMHARFMIPATPFYAMLLDDGVLALTTARRRWLQPVLAAGLCVAVALSVRPFKEVFGPRGIADEPHYYTRQLASDIDVKASELKRYTDGLDYSIAFLGSEARLVYRARVPVAVECETGLTDKFLARRRTPDDRQLRVGHDKTAPLSYLIDERKLDMVFESNARRRLALDGNIPEVDVRMGTLTGWMLHWDAALVKALRERGAEIDDFPAMLDDYLATMDAQSTTEIARSYEQFKRFYFNYVDDPPRQTPFEQRLAAP